MREDFLVAFVSKKIKNEFQLLKSGRFEDKKLYNSINKIIDELKCNPESGTKIPKRLWPKKYVNNFKITNLWKSNLVNAWRLIYSIKTNDVIIVSVVLEWFDHKEYEKRFKY